MSNNTDDNTKLLPKALNIIRPSSFYKQQEVEATSSTSTASTSSISTLSNFPSSSFQQQPNIVQSQFNYYSNNAWKSPTLTTNNIGVNPHRFLQRPRSNSNLSKSTYFSSLSISSYNGSDSEDDLDSIDGLSEQDEEEFEEEEEEEEEPQKVVAKIKHGIIMNGKGEFVNKGTSELLDEARTNRKIADLEIEKASLLLLNSTLEAKLRQQAETIADLQKRLQTNEGPLTPVSDKHVGDEQLYNEEEDEAVALRNEQEEIENDQVFQRIKQMLEGLILQAEVALLYKSKHGGKVIISPQEYYDNLQKQQNVQDALVKLTGPSPMMRPMSPPQHKPRRRVSDTSSVSSSSILSTSTTRYSGAKMNRSLSRQSSPPILQTRPLTPPVPPRSASPRYYNASQLRTKDHNEKPKWHF